MVLDRANELLGRHVRSLGCRRHSAHDNDDRNNLKQRSTADARGLRTAGSGADVDGRLVRRVQGTDYALFTKPNILEDNNEKGGAWVTVFTLGIAATVAFGNCRQRQLSAGRDCHHEMMTSIC